MRAIPTLVESIVDARPASARLDGAPRPPGPLLVPVAVGTYLALVVVGILAAFLAIEVAFASVGAGSLLRFPLVVGGLALVLAVPTLAREALAWLLGRLGY
ncbi:MAG: hypothetical protein QXG03_13070 [Halalkalicoccus sp.]